MYIQRNCRIYEEKIQKEMQEWFVQIQDKLRAEEITSLQDFKVLMENYNKSLQENRIPAALKQKSLILFLDYQQQVAEYISRNLVTALQNENRKINSQLELANEHFMRKKHELENEKDYLKNRIEEVEKESSGNKGMNAVLSARNEELIKDKKELRKHLRSVCSTLKTLLQRNSAISRKSIARSLRN